MDAVTALLTLRNFLRSNLTDAFVTAGGTRGTGIQYIYYNEPITSTKYPIIEIKKVNSPEEVISIGSSYTTSEQVFANIWVYSKNGFKVTVGGTEYLNSQLVEYLLCHIKDTIKNNFSTLNDSGIMVTTRNTGSIEYSPENQIYFGVVSVRLWFFR